MGEPKSALGRVTEGLLISAVWAVLGLIAALIWPPVRGWLLGYLLLPGWTIAAMGIVTFAALFVAARRRSQPQSAQSAIADKPVQPPFSPNPLQIECVRVLRYFDDEWVRFDDLATGLGQARGDVRQAIQGLMRAGWASNIIGYLDGPSYRLEGDGIAFAKSRNFEVGPPHDPYA
ncbi:hypothetical protein V8017_00030 [Stenotrophomonas rhizophila]